MPRQLGVQADATRRLSGLAHLEPLASERPRTQLQSRTQSRTQPSGRGLEISRTRAGPFLETLARPSLRIAEKILQAARQLGSLLIRVSFCLDGLVVDLQGREPDIVPGQEANAGAGRRTQAKAGPGPGPGLASEEPRANFSRSAIAKSSEEA